MVLVILGLGNDLLGDDAIGLLAVERLEGRVAANVHLRRSAQSGLYLLEALQGCDDAILIDSMLGDTPGKVREIDLADVRPLRVPSAHYAGLPEVLAVARSAGLRTPARVKILAVEIGGTQTIGAGPSPAVLAAIPEVVERVASTAKAWGYAGDTEEAGACTSRA